MYEREDLRHLLAGRPVVVSRETSTAGSIVMIKETDPWDAATLAALATDDELERGE